MLLFRRFRDEGGFLNRIIDMSTGKIPVDKEAIQYVDPKKLKKQIIESSSSSGDENEDWCETPSKGRKRRYGSDDSDEIDDFTETVRK